MRLGLVLEFILILAGALGLTRWCIGFTPFSTPGWGAFWSDLRLVTDSLFGGLAICGAFGIWVEAAGKRSPPVWGIGRRSWSIAAMAISIVAVANYPSHYAGLKWKVIVIPFFQDIIDYTKNHAGISFWDHSFDMILLAIWWTSRIDGSARDPAPDAREWAGRSLLVLIVAKGIFYRILYTLTG